MQAHWDPNLIVLDNVEQVAELIRIATDGAERGILTGYGGQGVHTAQPVSVAGMHIAVEEISEGQGNLAVLLVRYVLTVRILNAQEELEVE